MAKLILNDVTNILTAADVINQNNELIEAAMEKTWSRDGTSPNSVNANLDLNSYRIYNLPAPAGDTEPVRKFELDNFEAPEGPQGPPGEGVPVGGSTDQVLSKIDGTNYNTQWVSLTKTSVGLGNVDNTSDANKPVSTSTQTALDGKQNLDNTLTALAGVSTAADQVIYATGSDTFTTTPLTSFARTLLDDSDAATARTTLGAGDVVGPASATDGTVVRYNSSTGKLIKASSLLVSDTFGSLSRVGGGGISVQGSNTNDSAASGYYGEYVESVVISGSALAMTTATSLNVTSISLTAGDWDVDATGYILTAVSTVLQSGFTSISTTSATLDTNPGKFARYNFPSGFTPGSISTSFVTGTTRLSLNATTTVYLVMRSEFTTSTASAWGIIRARRVR